MKILFICSQNNPDFEVSPFVKSQADSLTAKGYEVDIFVVKIKKLKGVYSNIRKIKTITKNYDIVHAHYGTNGMIALLAGCRKKLIVSFLGSDLLGIKNRKNRQTFYGIVVKLISKIVIIKATNIIVKTKQLFDCIPNKYHKKSNIIPNGVDFEMFKPMECSLAIEKLGLKNKKYLLFTGKQTDENKNFSLLQNAINIINDENIEILATYPTEHKKMPLYMNASSCLVITSFTEGSSNVVKEALACNLPVVSVPAGDIAENINQIENCYITSYNPQDVALKIQNVLNTNKKTESRHKSQRFNIEIIADKIIEIYQNTLNSSLTCNSG